MDDLKDKKQKKKVKFLPATTFYFVDYEDRQSKWVADRLHFLRRVKKLEKLLNRNTQDFIKVDQH